MGKDIQEGNKLIAEFMGGIFYGDTQTILSNGILSPSGTIVKYVDKLKYHTSWDWLMPACKKWDSLDISDSYFDEYDRRTTLLKTITTHNLDCLESFKQLSENITWYTSLSSHENKSK